MFDKFADELSLEEAATIAAMLVYPRPKVPSDEWRQKLARRSEYVCSLYPSLKERFEKLPSWDAI
jgi:hypothetical protein